MHPLVIAALWFLLTQVDTRAAGFTAGAASIDITPAYPIRLSGYAARQKPSEGVRLALRAKALAIATGERDPVLLVTLDNCGLSRAHWAEIVRQLGARHHLAPERIVLLSSHTHSAPALTGAIDNLFVGPLPEAEQATVDRYTRELIDKVLEVASAALGRLGPARLYWNQGTVTFARNRRTPGGPVDRAVPMLAIRSADGDLKAVLANYACHCTTLQGDHNFIHGDWAGVAQRNLESLHPGTVALVSIGCGADANPFPRGRLEHVEAHGDELAQEVVRLLRVPALELTEPLDCRAREIELPHEPLPSREAWQKRAAEPGIVGYHARRNLERLNRGETLPATLPYWVQTWNFGSQLALVFLPGEVVVDYVVRLKNEFDPARLWVSAYANWVPCYIPSERILREGGYEAEHSLWYYDRPARLSATVENQIIATVHDLLPAPFRAEKP